MHGKHFIVVAGKNNRRRTNARGLLFPNPLQGLGETPKYSFDSPILSAAPTQNLDFVRVVRGLGERLS
jgi:hypothetical protein